MLPACAVLQNACIDQRHKNSRAGQYETNQPIDNEGKAAHAALEHRFTGNKHQSGGAENDSSEPPPFYIGPGHGRNLASNDWQGNLALFHHRNCKGREFRLSWRVAFNLQLERIYANHKAACDISG